MSFVHNNVVKNIALRVYPMSAAAKGPQHTTLVVPDVERFFSDDTKPIAASYDAICNRLADSATVLLLVADPIAVHRTQLRKFQEIASDIADAITDIELGYNNIQGIFSMGVGALLAIEALAMLDRKDIKMVFYNMPSEMREWNEGSPSLILSKYQGDALCIYSNSSEYGAHNVANAFKTVRIKNPKLSHVSFKTLKNVPAFTRANILELNEMFTETSAFYSSEN